MYILVQENKKEKVEQRKEKEDDIYIEKIVSSWLKQVFHTCKKRTFFVKLRKPNE